MLNMGYVRTLKCKTHAVFQCVSDSRLVTEMSLKYYIYRHNRDMMPLSCPGKAIIRSRILSLDCSRFLVPWGGMRPSLLGTSATSWPIVPAPDDRWVWSIWCNENWEGKPKYSEKTCPSATLSAMNLTWPHLGRNHGRRGGKRATNRMNYDMALFIVPLHYDQCLSNCKNLRFLVERYEVWILVT
jgi:hypothetical protein